MADTTMPWDPVGEETTMPWDEIGGGGESSEDDALLPEIDVSENMYDSFATIGEARAYYAKIIERDEEGNIKHPDVSVVNDSPSINDANKVYVYTNPNTGERNRIYTPNRAMFGFSDRPTVNAMQLAGAGISESLQDVVETGAAIIDKAPQAVANALDYASYTDDSPAAKLADKVSTIQPNLTEKVQANTFGTKTEGIGASLIADGLPAVIAAFAPGLGIYRVGQTITQGLANAPKVIQLMGNVIRTAPAALIGEAAAVSTVGIEEDTFLFGPGQVFGDISPDLGDDASARVLEQRMNMLADGMLAGGVISAVGKTVKDVGTLGYDLLLSAYFTLAKPEREVYLRLSAELANLGEDATEEQLAVVRQNIAKIIEENKEILVRDINNLDENRPVILDTVSAYLKGGLEQGDAANAQRIRAGQVNSAGGEQVKEAMDRPVVELNTQLGAQADNLTEGSTNQAVLQDSANEFVDVARRDTTQILEQNAQELQAEYNRKAGGLVQAIGDDLGLIARLEDASGTQIADPKTAARVDIQNGLEESYTRMVDEKNSRYAAIQGGTVDERAIFDLFSRMPVEEITKASVAFSRGNNILREVQPRMIEVLEETDDGVEELVRRLETDDEVVERLGQFLDANGADFGFFYTKLRPEFAQLASAAFDNNNPLLGRYYRDVLNFIDEDMLDVVAKRDPELADAAMEAKRYYKDEFAPIWRDTDSMEQFSNLWDSTLGRTPRSDMEKIVTQTEPFRPGFNAKAEDLTKGILEGGNTARTVNLARAIDGASDPTAIADYMIVDTINNFYNQIKNTGLEDGAIIATQDGRLLTADLSNLTMTLRNYAEQLNALAQTSPEMADKVTSLNTFIARVEEASQSANAVKNVEDVLAGVQQASEGMLKDVEDSVISNFFNTERTPALKRLLQTGSGDSIVTTSNPQAAFEKIFGAGQRLGGESRQRVTELMDIIAQQPEAEQVILTKGLKLAYNNFLTSKVFAKTPELGGVMPVRSAGIGDMLTDRDSALDLGRIIYRDTPEIPDAMEAILTAAKETTDTARATPIRSQSATGFNVAARSASTRLIYLAVGPLSRAGARLRALSNLGIDKLDAETRANNILNSIMANPDEYLALARKYNRNPRDPLMEDLMVGFIGRALVKSEGDSDQEVEDMLKNASESIPRP